MSKMDEAAQVRWQLKEELRSIPDGDVDHPDANKAFYRTAYRDGYREGIRKALEIACRTGVDHE